MSALFPPHFAKKSQKQSATPKSSSFSAQLALLGALNRLASAHNVAVVVLSHVSTRIRYNSRAFLVPALDTKEWDDNFASRIALFRDTAPNFWSTQPETAETELLARLRYAGIVKAHGQSSIDQETLRDIVAFGLNDVSAKLLP